MLRLLTVRGVLVLLLLQALSRIAYGMEDPILFERGDTCVYAIDSDGTNLRKVTDGERPVPSPDGRSVLVARQRTIWLVALDGSAPVALGEGTAYSWSPDGESIVYQGNGIELVRRDGTGRRELAAGSAWWPRWSLIPPAEVYYNLGGGMGIPDLFAIEMATAQTRRIRADTSIPQVNYPFSPDGTRLVVSDCGDGNFCVKVLALATGALHQVGGTGAQRPAWSPDGRCIAFDAFDGMAGLHVADADGQATRELVPGRGEAAPVGPVWSPNGDMIAFQLVDWMSGQQNRICVVHADGGEVRVLTEGEWPVWSTIPARSQPQEGDTGSVVQPESWGAVKAQPE